MHDSPATRATLLIRLGDEADREAWEQFVEIYAPLVYRYARRRGLQDADAADLAQEVLWRAADAFRRCKYDRSRGNFRGWLLTIARNELFDWLGGQARREQPGGGTTGLQALSELAAHDEAESWRREYDERLFQWACERVRAESRPQAWEAFERTALHEQSGQEVAAALGISVATVYLAKSRVLKRMRELIAEVSDDEVE